MAKAVWEIKAGKDLTVIKMKKAVNPSKMGQMKSS